MRIDRVVVGMDFSESAASAARWTARYLAPGEVVLAHAVDLPQPPAFLRRVLPSGEEVAALAIAEADRRLHEFAGSVEGQFVCESRTGTAPQVIADIAKGREADLIVVGEHGSGRRGRSLLGTTAERVLACAPVPVLIAREMPHAAPAAVLTPLDGSPTDGRVLGWGRLLHERYGTRVVACHAVDVMEVYRRVRTISAAARMREMESQFRTNAESWIRERLQEARLPADDENVEVRLGDPRHAIPSMAERAQADLIIMGGRGAGAVSRFVLGSVTSSILNTSTWAVLVVVGEDRD